MLSLSGLHVSAWKMTEFTNFIQNNTTLVSLTLDIVVLSMEDNFTFSLSSLPNLCHLTCSQSLLFCLTGTHNLLQLSLPCPSSRDTQAPLLVPQASILDNWLSIGRYRSISRLVIPLSLAFEITSDPVRQPAMETLQKLTIFGTLLNYDEDEFLKVGWNLISSD
ncbi:hypothetical protein GYMLUDRAFT_39771 [Collybiopsis luxurians FD-317 M1]|nr:hypothetical protein GYMLUDRAFT_39771 [Collybiopsis luxurians FD-317 M1]